MKKVIFKRLNSIKRLVINIKTYKFNLTNFIHTLN